jgi:hypothetical protein
MRFFNLIFFERVFIENNPNRGQKGTVKKYNVLILIVQNKYYDKISNVFTSKLFCLSF